VPSEVDECSQQLEFGADGTAGPTTCANGYLNVLDWQYYAKSGLQSLTLGRYATPAQVEQALCADAHATTNPIASDGYELAKLYYGWQFGIDPTQELYNGSC
jgi:hypothetical protein